MVVMSARYVDTIGLGSIVSIITIGAGLIGLWRWMRKMLRNSDRSRELPEQMDTVISKLGAIEEQARLWREDSVRWHEDHIRIDHLRKR